MLSLGAKSLPMAGGTGCLCWGGQGTLQPIGSFGLSTGETQRQRDKFPPGEIACPAALTVSMEVVLKPGANGVFGHTPGELCHCQPLHGPL